MGSEFNPFSILGIPEAAQIPPELIREKAIEQLRKVHPDHARGRPRDAPTESFTAQDVNRAQRELGDRESRLNFLYKKYLGDISEEKTNEKNSRALQFAQIWFEVEDDLEPAERILPLVENIRSRLFELTQSMQAAISEFDQADHFDEKKTALRRIRQAQLELKPLESLLAQIQKTRVLP